MPSYHVHYRKISNPNMKGNKNMSGKDIEEIKSKFNKSAHAKTDEIFEIKLGSKVVWTA
jgi:hypothetical protein